MVILFPGRGPHRKAIIHSAIREWEEFTCIRFKPRTYQNEYIEFFVRLDKGRVCTPENLFHRIEDRGPEVYCIIIL